MNQRSQRLVGIFVSILMVWLLVDVIYIVKFQVWNHQILDWLLNSAHYLAWVWGFSCYFNHQFSAARRWFLRMMAALALYAGTTVFVLVIGVPIHMLVGGYL